MPPAAPETIYASEDLLIQCFNPDASRAVTVFDFRHVRTGGFTDLKPSRKVLQAKQAYITVASKKNDWFLSSSLEDCKPSVSEFTKRFDRVVGFGSSMGAYGALAMSRAFRFKQVLVVSPQATPFPNKPPFDVRFANHASTLDPNFDRLLDEPRKGLGGIILFDPQIRLDRLHVRLIQNAFPRLKTRAFPFAGHPALGVHMAAEKFGLIQDELIAHRMSGNRLLSQFKSLRANSEPYNEALRAYLLRRS